MLRAVIFDMDGVLLDSEPIYVENNARIYRQLGIDVPMEEQMSYVGIDPEHMWNSIIKNYSLSDSVDELIEIEKKAQFEIFNEKDLSPVEGIEEFLDQLEQLNIPVAVASSSYSRIIKMILEKIGIISRFEVIVSGEDIANGKPDPEIFLETASKLEFAPAACLVVEDSPHGIKGAKEAGMTVAGFQNPGSGSQDLSQADLIVPDFSLESRDKIFEMLTKL